MATDINNVILLQVSENELKTGWKDENPPIKDCFWTLLFLVVLEEEFQLHPNDLKVTIGEPWLLQCVPPLGHPEPTVSWKKNGVPISPENGHYEVAKLVLTTYFKQHLDLSSLET